VFDVYSSARLVDVDGVSISVADHGPAGGPSVLMIHGFPDSARLWRNQVPLLTEAGYRVLVPDLRGFGRSDRPVNVEDYKIRYMADDILAILDEAEIDKAHIVGHDWGAAVAWYLALSSSDRLKSLTALSVGHPAAFAAAGFRQREKSWYMLLFQFEGVAEKWLSDNDWSGLRGWTGQDQEVDHWIEDLGRPGALTAALNVYRANVSPSSFVSLPSKLPPAKVPTMGAWSTGDIALLEEQMKGTDAHMAAEWRYERIEGASHWIPIDAPDELSRLLLDWLGVIELTSPNS